MTDLNNAVVLITGATGGFGQELVRQLLAAGSQLILTDLKQTTLEELITEVERQPSPGKVLACFATDLSAADGSDTLYHQVKSLGQPIDVLINNAGIGVYGRMDEVPREKWERLMQVNLLAPMRLSSLFAADMVARRRGHIVNISSLAGWIGQAGLGAYSASKFGLRGFSESLADELKAYNVKVTAVYPFFSRTPILQSERFGTMATEYPGVPLEWTTDPAEVMRATIQAIRADQLHLFPDRQAQTLHLLKRYAPQLLGWINQAFTRRLKSDSVQSSQ